MLEYNACIENLNGVYFGTNCIINNESIMSYHYISLPCIVMPYSCLRNFQYKQFNTIISFIFLQAKFYFISIGLDLLKDIKSLQVHILVCGKMPSTHQVFKASSPKLQKSPINNKTLREWGKKCVLIWKTSTSKQLQIHLFFFKNITLAPYSH